MGGERASTGDLLLLPVNPPAPGSSLNSCPPPCSYDQNGVLTGQVGAARTVGTTIAVRELFKRLPVR